MPAGRCPTAPRSRGPQPQVGDAAGRPGISHAPRPEEDWIAVPVPAIVSEETFAQVQAKLDANQQGAARNTRHEYLLRALISCGACRLGCTGRQTGAGYRYYLCRGRTDPLRAAQGQRCTARYIPAGQLDELVWADLCTLLTDPAQVTRALARAQGGAWLPQELQARQATIGQALGQLERQQQRLLDAYLAEVVTLPELDRKRQDLDRRHDTLLAQQRQLDAAARQKLELGAVADGIEAFCQAVRAGLATATFEQRRLLAELLIDRVVVTDGDVEIRYVLPTSPDGPHRPFCQLRKDHLDLPALVIQGDQPGRRVAAPVEQRGGQPVNPGVPAGAGGDGDLALDHPDLHRADLRQERPVTVAAQHRRLAVALDADQQVRLRGGELADQRGDIEVTVQQHDHAGVQAARQPPGAVLLTAADRAEDRVDDRARAAGHQGHQPQQRVARPAVAAGLLTVDGQVPGAIGDAHDGAVNSAHQQPVPADRPGRDRRGRTAQQVKQPPQRRGAEPRAGLPQGVITGTGRRQRAQAGDQLVPHLPVPQLSEQAPGQQQVDHHPRRQHPKTRLSRAGSRQRLIHHLERHDLGQLTQMTGREHPCRYLDLPRDDTLVH